MSDYRRLRPPLPESPAGQPEVLVVGAYLADAPTNIGHVYAELRRSAGHRVRQLWVSVGGPAHPGVPTALSLPARVPKFAAVNALLARADLTGPDYLLVCDDDIELPPGFLDRFLGVQAEFDFGLAQPARSANSPGDHPIVRREMGLLARQTLFVESGPCFAAHRTVFASLLPFDLTSPMGWGYEYVWARRLAERGIRMGVVDATPVEHVLRATASRYDWWQAYQQQLAFLTAHPHLSETDSHRVLRVFPAREGVVHGAAGDFRRPAPPPG